MRSIYLIELAVIILLWTFAIISPLLFMDDYNQNWRAVYVMWSECAVVGFAFLVNRFIMMPYLFFTKRYVLYVGALVGLFVFLSLFVLCFDGVNRLTDLFIHIYNSDLVVPSTSEEAFAPFSNIPHQRPPHSFSSYMHTPHGMPPMSMPPSITAIPPMITLLILSMIAIALDMGLSIAVKWIVIEHMQTQADKDRVSTQLANLQSQVSPHFFMNTLNNIHALVDIDSERAKHTIIELSGLMDYLLYESSNKKAIELQRELDFVNSYIHLMRQRFPKQVKISFSYDNNVPAVKIPPLIFLNFIENSFKYGVDYEQPSFIKIRFDFSANSVNMVALNSNYSHSVRRVRRGLGISNAKKRLDLLYGDMYVLDISEKEKIYYVNLKIPIT